MCIISKVDASVLEVDGSEVREGAAYYLPLDCILAEFGRLLQAEYDRGRADPKLKQRYLSPTIFFLSCG